MGDDEEGKSLSANKLYIWSSGLLEFGLFNLGCDPFAVRRSHSDGHPNDRHEKERTDGGRVFGDYFDKLRRKWSKLIFVVIVFMCSKCISVMIFRGLIGLAKSYGHPSAHHYLKQFAWLVGDPYSSISIVSMLVCLGNPLSCLIARCAIAYQLANNQPLDCSFIHFVLDPEREMRRIDADAVRQVEETIEALAKYRSDLSDIIHLYRRFETALNNRRDPTVQLTLAGWQTSQARASNQLNWLRLLRSQTSLIRPKAFSYEKHRQCYLMLLAFLWVCGFGAFITVFPAELIVTYFSWMIRCQQRSMVNGEVLTHTPTNSSICPLMDVFTWPELLTMFEIDLLGLINLVLNYVFLYGIHLLQIHHQLYLTSNMSTELDKLLRDLRRLDLPSGGQLKGEQAERLSEIDCFLYTNIISLFIHERESRKNTRTISRIPILGVINVFVFTVITFAVFGSSMKDSKGSRTGEQTDSMFLFVRSIGGYELDGDANIAIMLWLIVWIGSNLVVLPGASVPFRVRRMKRTVLSIMAEICRLQMIMKPHKLPLLYLSQSVQDVQGCPSDLGENDPLARLWRRFVLSKSFAHDHHTAVIFKLQVTYKNILELNLLVATLISLLTVRAGNSGGQLMTFAWSSNS